MKNESTEVEIYDSNDKKQMAKLEQNLDNFGESIQDYLQFDNYYLMVRNTRSYKKIRSCD